MRSFLVVGIFLYLASSAIVQADDRNAQALELIAATAVKLCGTVKDSGSTKSAELSAEATAELNGLLRRLTSLGVKISGKHSSNEYAGVLQKDLATVLKDNSSCRLDVLRELKETLLSPVAALPPQRCFPQFASVGIQSSQLSDDVRRDPNSINTALLGVASSGDLQCTKSLIAAGAKANGVIEPKFGQVPSVTPLFEAIQSGSVEIVQELLKAGADPNLRVLSGVGIPPIVEAASRSKVLALTLMQAGADVNAVDRDGFTALHRAAIRNDGDLANALIKSGARLEVRDRFAKKTPLEWAIDKNSQAVAQLLAGK